MTWLFKDHDVFGRHVVIAIAVLLVGAIWLGRIGLSAGPRFSRFCGPVSSSRTRSRASSPSFRGPCGYHVRGRLCGACCSWAPPPCVLAGAAFVAANAVSDSARQAERGRTRLGHVTWVVFREAIPLVRVGIGGREGENARTQRSARRDARTTTPLTVTCRPPRTPRCLRARALPRSRAASVRWDRRRRGVPRAVHSLAVLRRLLRRSDRLGCDGARRLGIRRPASHSTERRSPTPGERSNDDGPGERSVRAAGRQAPLAAGCAADRLILLLVVLLIVGAGSGLPQVAGASRRETRHEAQRRSAIRCDQHHMLERPPRRSATTSSTTSAAGTISADQPGARQRQGVESSPVVHVVYFGTKLERGRLFAVYVRTGNV